MKPDFTRRGFVGAGVAAATQAVFNPATGAQTGVVDLARTEDVDAAVAAAQKAFPAWGERLGEDFVVDLSGYGAIADETAIFLEALK